MPAYREVAEGQQWQGKDEKITYTITVSPAPTSITAVYVFDCTDLDTDAKSTHMPTGSASFVGSVITLPPLTALVLDHEYRIECKYTDGVNILEPYFFVYCNR
jgi:hypothetical protein